MAAILPTTSSPYVSITDFGAVGDGNADNTAAIQSALNYAAAHGEAVYVPAGIFNYSGVITDNGVGLYGAGVGSLLQAKDPNNEAIELTGNGGSISNLQISGTGATRLTPFSTAAIWINGATNFTVQNVLVNRSASVGIFNVGGSHGLITGNTVQNTLADSISNIAAASYITVSNNRILNSGDDGISTVSYHNVNYGSGDVAASIVHDITVSGNTVLNNLWANGISVDGGENEQISGNHIEGGPAGAAGIIIAASSDFNTFGVINVTVNGNTLINSGGLPTGTGNGAITIYNTEGTSASISGVMLSGNQIVNPLWNAVLLAGNGSISVQNENNTSYSTNNFLLNIAPLGVITETNDQVYSPSSYVAPLVPAGGGVSNGTAPPLISAPVSVGSGSDILILSISEDAYANGDGTSDPNGDAAFTVCIDGKQLAGTFFAMASQAAGATQAFTFEGNWGPGSHTVTINFINDAWDGTVSTDRNLYVDDVIYDGTDTKQTASLYSAGAQNLGVTDTTALPPAVTGAGSDALVIKVSEDAYKGDAQFTVKIDGKQLGGTFTATTLHSSGGSQSFAFAGDFGSGSHIVTVTFLNDRYAGTPSTDRNLYVNDLIYNGVDTGKGSALMANGSKTFAVTGGTTPSVAETSDHGSLTKNLAQTGTYIVGGDTFVLTIGNAATVTLGTGTSQVKFLGASSVTLTGGSGQATVTSDLGNNSFAAGSGSLDVTGGAGKDAYMYHATSGMLVVEDFSLAKGDTLSIDKSLQSSFHHGSDGMGGSMLTFGSAAHGIDLHGAATLASSNIHWL